MVHVKRQLYSTKKPEHRRQKNRTPRATEKQFDQKSGSTSPSATWNSTLYTPMQFFPWQTSLQVPFTLYAPFGNPYQLAQTQQGPVGGFPSVRGLGLAGQFTQSPTNPSMMWTQSSGSCEGNVKSVSSSTSMHHETKNAGIVSAQETLPVEAVESTLSHEHFFRRKQLNFFVVLLSLFRVRTFVLNHSFTLHPPYHPHVHELIHAVIQKFVQHHVPFLNGIRIE